MSEDAGLPERDVEIVGRDLVTIALLDLMGIFYVDQRGGLDAGTTLSCIIHTRFGAC